MKDRAGLRSDSLAFPEVLAASVALIGPSMTPVLIAPYMYASAGNASWLAYVFGGVMLLFVALNLNQFARRSSGAGSMYEYASANLGPTMGALAGWVLIWAYIFVGASQFGAMTLFVQNLLGLHGWHVPDLLIFAAAALVWWYFAYRDIQLSTIVMLALEAISVSIISILVFLVLFRHGPHVDPAQVHLQGLTVSQIGPGIAFAIFSFVGFESATAFGEEAKRPLVTIPRAVLASVVLASIFFILCIYAEIAGLRHSKTPLDQLSAPLWTLADLYGAGYFKIPIGIGAIFSSFSVALACVTTGARIILPMARKGLFPAGATRIQERFATPYVAVAVFVAAMLIVALSMYAARVTPINIFNYCGTLSSFGFIVIYAFIAIAAPRFLRRIGDHRARDYTIAALALLFLFVPAATLFYPVPPPPTNAFAYIFVAYLAVGWAYFAVRRRAKLPAPASP
ncbi:MAG TPA: APC family permease [Candidatus Baltobacteraceae bacterium]|jgi:amino acid transporter|nr:APC family permease [Candidatus Baltobacteraceae bacterium]